MNPKDTADQLLSLLSKEVDEYKDHLHREKLDYEDPDYIDSSWIYDMYRATDALNRDVPWEEIIRILYEYDKSVHGKLHSSEYELPKIHDLITVDGVPYRVIGFNHDKHPPQMLLRVEIK